MPKPETHRRRHFEIVGDFWTFAAVSDVDENENIVTPYLEITFRASPALLVPFPAVEELAVMLMTMDEAAAEVRAETAKRGD